MSEQPTRTNRAEEEQVIPFIIRSIGFNSIETSTERHEHLHVFGISGPGYRYSLDFPAVFLRVGEGSLTPSPDSPAAAEIDAKSLTEELYVRLFDNVTAVTGLQLKEKEMILMVQVTDGRSIGAVEKEIFRTVFPEASPEVVQKNSKKKEQEKHKKPGEEAGRVSLAEFLNTSRPPSESQSTRKTPRPTGPLVDPLEQARIEEAWRENRGYY